MSDRPAFPHTTIRETQDRSWTMRLISWLGEASLDQAERTEIVRTLDCLADPRAVSPLLRVLENTALAAAYRDAAGRVLRGWAVVGADVVREQWRTGDDLLKRHAMLSMEHPDAAIVEAGHEGAPSPGVRWPALGRLSAATSHDGFSGREA